MNSLERLNFSNGRLLEAADLSLEQHYHVAIRRMLNRGLFTPGVVNGLEVTEKDKRTVTVGRELYVAVDEDVAVPNQLPVDQDRTGYFLALRYEEEPVPGAAHPCDAEGAAPDPARIRERPRLEWTEEWPAHNHCGEPTGRPIDCAVVIALVTLDDSCQIARIETAFRQYAYPAHLSQVQAVALEGEKDLDSANPKTLHFNIRGGTPSAVVLYLWGEEFSSLYYSELGAHSHALEALQLSSTTVDLGNHTHTIGHTHSASVSGSTGGGGHRHALKVEVDHGYRVATSSGWSAQYAYVDQPGGSVPYTQDNGGQHSHSFSASGSTGGPSPASSGGPSPNSSAQGHTHQLTGAGLSETGNGPAIRTGAKYAWLADLRVELDGTDITQALLDRFLSSWTQFGNGSQAHPLNAPGGTGPLNLLALGRRIDQGPHTIRLRVAQGGGKVLYNLYVS